MTMHKKARRRPWVFMAVLVVTAIVAASCAADDAAEPDTATTATPVTAEPEPDAPTTTAAAAPVPTEPEPLEEVGVRLSWLVNGYDAPLILAQQKGYFEDEGLDVTIQEGNGSGTLIQTVAAGEDDFGTPDSGALVRAITNEDIPVKNLAVYLQTIPTGFVFLGGTEFNDVPDLVNLTTIASAGSAEYALLPAVLEPYDMTLDDITVELVGPEAGVQVLLASEDSVLLGFATGDFLRVKAEDPSAQYRSFGDFGIVSYGIGLITNLTMIDERPEVVEALMNGLTRGWLDAIENPEEAVDATIALFPDASADQIAEGLDITLALLHTPATEGLDPGVTSEEDWEAMLELFEESGLIDEAPQPVDRYFTNEFTAE